MYAALHALAVLLVSAETSDLMTVSAAAGSLAISMRRQLQQAGVLQHLTAVMAALAADLRSEATALAGQSAGELCSDLGRFRSSAPARVLAARHRSR
jgi:hypothetical protein